MREQSPNHHYGERLEQRFASGILEELQPYPHFVTWKTIYPQGKPKKLPFNPLTDKPASTTNPDTWATLDQALTALKTGRFDGIGFVFAEDDPFTGIDIDHCVLNNQLTQEASELVTDLWSYTELSPSRTGLHILVEGTIPEGRRRNGIEAYSTGRYFTITTNHLKGSPDEICNRQSQLDSLYAKLAPEKPVERAIHRQEYQLFVSDEVVRKKAQDAKNGDSFTLLYNGHIAGSTSKSEADFELILRLLYWTNDDIAQVRRLFLGSQLVDEKTLRPTNGTTYLDETIANAVKKRNRRG